jgi:hypothetical protein
MAAHLPRCKEEVMNQRWLAIAAALVLAALIGAAAYNLGVHQGLAQSGKVLTAPPGPYPYPYPYYGWHPWGFGFFFFPFFFIALWFLIFRGIFWRGRGYRYGYGCGPDPREREDNPDRR